MNAPVRHADLRLKPHTFDDFLRFCESRPKDEEYEWTNPDRCACGQYSAEIGGTWYTISRNQPFWVAANRLAGNMDNTHVTYATRDWNFGTLAERVRAFIKAKS